MRDSVGVRIGGALLTEAQDMHIGAFGYVRDAASVVHKTRELLEVTSS